MRDGRIVPMQKDFGRGPRADRKFLIVLQYYNGDIEETEDLASIIADLERVRNKDADILLFGRHDARPISSAIKAKLETKFDQVHTAICRNKDAKSYPFATNNMFYDLVALLGQYAQWTDNYFAFINMESDAVPVHPGWIKQLITEFRGATVHGHACIGHIHDDGGGRIHMNGLAVYAIDIFQRVPGGKLRGGAPSVAYDIFQAKNILPLAFDTPLIQMQYRRPTITAADLFKPWKGGIEPALWHGVKDASAREAVKARHITFSESKDLSRHTVFTYFDSEQQNGRIESNELLDLWRQAWSSRGWNPVILRSMDAARSGRYREICATVEKLPCVGDKARQKARFLRWCALDSVGGGLLVENDMIPGAFTPDRLTDKRWEDLQTKGNILAELLAAMVTYTVQPDDLFNGQPHVDDRTIIARVIPVPLDLSLANYGAEDWDRAQVVSFSDAAISSSPMRGKRKSDIIQQYLRGN